MHIQLALDRLTIEQAIAAAKPVSAYIDWIEVGTSLIKEFGMESVRAIKNAFPNHLIVADAKTFDNAIYEFEMCYTAGADMVTVMGAAPKVTVEASMNVAAKRGKLVMIDLLHATEEQAKWLSVYSEAIFCLHVSKDEQEMQGGAQGANTVPVSLLQGTKLKLAFAGGITADSMVKLMSYDPYAAVVGSAITKANNPVLAAKAFEDFRSGESHMNIVESIFQELHSVLERPELKRWEEIAAALSDKRIFVIGEGRSGLMAKSFAMRLMHLGADIFVVGETITPSISREDLLIAVSGSGTTKQVVWVAQKAKELGSTVIAVTTDPSSALAVLADRILHIPAATKYRKTGENASIQPLGSLFDQSAHILFDAICLRYASIKSVDNKAAFQRHSNME